MPMLVGVLIVLAAMYQLFFRYETWSSDDKPGVRYEHDTLTGETRMLKPGAKVNVFARILGTNSGNEGETRFLEPLDEDLARETEKSLSRSSDTTAETSVDPEKIDLKDNRQVEKVAQPVPIPREVVVASSAPPVPGGNMASDGPSGNPFAVRQIDLDQDGSSEEIIQNAGQSDGLLDISIVKNGKEIFFGRGQQISLLPTRNRGWADIALKMGSKTLQVFRYDVRTSAYKAIDGNEG
jgi:hypothetical protein